MSSCVLMIQNSNTNNKAYFTSMLNINVKYQIHNYRDGSAHLSQILILGSSSWKQYILLICSLLLYKTSLNSKYIEDKEPIKS